MKEEIMIYGDENDRTVKRTAYSQTMAFLIIQQMHKDGYKNIRFSFEQMDSLPKGVK